MCETEGQGFEAWRKPWQFFPSILLYNSTIASWIIAVIMMYIYLHVGWHFSLLLVAFSPSFSQPVFEHSSIKCCRNSLFYNNQLFFFSVIFTAWLWTYFLFSVSPWYSIIFLCLAFPCASYKNQKFLFSVIFTTCLRKFSLFCDNPWHNMIPTFLLYFFCLSSGNTT